MFIRPSISVLQQILAINTDCHIPGYCQSLLIVTALVIDYL